MARLVELQARAITAGLRKPTYGDLICAAITTLDPTAVVDQLESNGK